MSFENSAYAPGSPGKVFLLGEDDLVERLERLEVISNGALAWSETAGLRQIIRHESRPLEEEQGILRANLMEKRTREAA